MDRFATRSSALAASRVEPLARNIPVPEVPSPTSRSPSEIVRVEAFRFMISQLMRLAPGAMALMPEKFMTSIKPSAVETSSPPSSIWEPL